MEKKESSDYWASIYENDRFVRFANGSPVATISKNKDGMFVGLYSVYEKERGVVQVSEKFDIPLEGILWIDCYLKSLGFKNAKWPSISKII